MMDYHVSARKFRPGAFDELIGQTHVVRTLRNAILRKQVAHAYLFSGMRGVGKTTAARILAKALNCETGPTPDPCGRCGSCVEITQGHSVDVIEIDGASNTGVDDVRELRENVKFSPFRGTYRVYIIDEVHMLSTSAFNALLKTLEEPPPHAVFVFATTEAHKIPATITSRCQHFNFRRIPRREIIARLQSVARRLEIAVEERSLGVMAGASEGSLRDALSLFDQAVAFGGDAITERDVEVMLGAVPDRLVSRLVGTVMHRDPAGAVALIGEAVEQGHDLRAWCGAVVERVRHVMIAAVARDVEQAQGLIDLPADEVERVMREARSFSVEQLQDLFHLFAQAEDRLRSTGRPRFVFEVAAVRAAGGLPRAEQTTSAAAVDGKAAPGADASRSSSPSPPRPSSSAPARQGGRSVPPADRSGRGPVAAAPRRGDAPSPAPPPTGPAPAPPRTTPAAPAPQQTPAPTGSSVMRREDWLRVVKIVTERHPNVGAFLGMGTLVNVEDLQVVVGFPRSESVACSMIAKDRNRDLIAGICREVAGAVVRLCVVELPETPRDGATIKQMREQQQQRDDEALLERVRDNPVVKQTQDLFGVEVVKARRTPDGKEA